MGSVAAKPARRSTAEVRRLILNAARELFEARGYEGTQTLEIAERAGVQERMLFRNFGSKAGLFHAAVTEPLAEVIADYSTAWVDHPEDSTDEERIAGLINGLFDFACANRTALRAALAGPARNGRGPGEDLADRIATEIHSTLRLGTINEILAGYQDVDATALLIDIAGMAFGVALLDDLLVPRGTRRPSRRRLVDEMLSSILSGVAARRRES
jgi:AcrR family transcriptional regulator